MKTTTRRFVLAIAATFVLVLSCYGLARAYLYYEAGRAERMLKELGDVKLGDAESQVLAMLQRYGKYQKMPEDLAKFDKADYEYLVEIGPSGIYHVLGRDNTGRFYRITRAVLSSLSPQFRRVIGLRRWNVYGRVGIKENRVTVVCGMVLVEGSHGWLFGDWILAKTIPPYAIKKFVTSPGVSWPYDVNHYLMGWEGGPMMNELHQEGWAGGPDTSITPDATENEKRAAHGFRLECLTSRSGCRTVCDLYPAAVEYAASGTWEERMEVCAAPSPDNSYW
jgi:hypothetical protein